MTTNDTKCRILFNATADYGRCETHDIYGLNDGATQCHHSGQSGWEAKAEHLELAVELVQKRSRKLSADLAATQAKVQRVEKLADTFAQVHNRLWGDVTANRREDLRELCSFARRVHDDLRAALEDK